MGQDWVARRATCNIRTLLNELYDHVQRDVDTANLGTDSKFDLIFENRESFRPFQDTKFGVAKLKKRGVVYLDPGNSNVDTFVTFRGNDDDQKIEILEWINQPNEARTKFSVDVKWDDDSQCCLVQVEGASISISQICQRALKEIFFNN